MSSRSPAAEIVRTTLAQIPSIFGRLVYLSSLRNAGSGSYEHATLTQLLGVEEADYALRAGHRQAFSSWLESSLEDQKKDLDRYLAYAGPTAGRPISDLDELAAYLELIPDTACDIERQLYISDLETLLGQLRLERSSDSWRP